MEKVNFAGGEPFIVKRGSYLGELVRFCKEELKLPSVTIVSNGSLITEKWFEKYGKYQHQVIKTCIQRHAFITENM
jgi:radical S-adenosyl methionine domain-containing protein 2